MTTKLEKSFAFSKSSDTGFLMILFPEHQEELEAPYSINKQENFFVVEGIHNEQLVTYVIPDTIECYFEIRQEYFTTEKKIID